MTLEIVAVEGIGEVVTGTDLAQLVVAHAELREGDVVAVTSKVVSKALGLATDRDRLDVIDDQTDRVVAQRGGTRIVRTHHGLTMAAAGVDASNTASGTVLPLPDDPDAEARRIRAGIADRLGIQVGVVVTDTAGRAWRVGQTDVAIGCAGIVPVESFAGREDTHGNPLAVTAPAVADEIAGAAELASGKLGGRPVVVLRGLPSHLLTDDDGPGAAALVRDEDGDLFGLGSREAVLAAAHRESHRGFPTGEWTVDDVVRQAGVMGATVRVDGRTVTVSAPTADAVTAGRVAERIEALAHAHRVDLVVDVDLAD